MRWRHALLQLGDFDGADRCVDEGIDVAREGDATYELALSLQAAAELGERSGADGEAHAAEAATLLEALGIVSVPEVPLPPVSGG
jgi:hypothetical protein